MLQVGGYVGYAALARRGDITLALCWAHVRPRFCELAKAGASRAATGALTRIASLYAIEDAERGAAPEVRLAAQHEHSREVVANLNRFLRAGLTSWRTVAKGSSASTLFKSHCSSSHK